MPLLRFLIALLLLAGCALAQSPEQLERELAGYQEQLARHPQARRMLAAQHWRKAVLAWRSESRNLGPVVADAVKLAGFAFIELRASRGLGNRPGALRVLIGASERAPLLEGRFPFLEPRSSEDGLLLAGVSLAPGASLMPVPDDRTARLRRRRDEARAALALIPKTAALPKLLQDNRALARQVGWKTLGPEKPEQIAASLAKQLPASLTPGLELRKLTPLGLERLALTADVSWVGQRFEVSLSGTPGELAAQLKSWESFGLDRPILLEMVEIDLQGARARFIAFLRQPY